MFKDYIEKRRGWLTLLIITILIVPSYFSISNYFLVLLLLLSPFFLQKDIILKHKWPIVITVITVIIYVIFYRKFLIYSACKIDIGQVIPIPLLILLSSFIGFYFRNYRLPILIFSFFFCLEAIVGIVEFILGVQSFFVENASLIKTPNNYIFSRPGVYGLSDGSSSFAVNMLCLVFLANSYYSKTIRYILIGIGILGVILSSNKTMTIGMVVYLITSLLFFKHNKNIKYALATLIVITNGILFYFVIFPEPIINIVLTGRLPIYEAFVKFIRGNILFGNYFKPLRIISDSGKVIHSHNSLLQLAADNGLVYTCLFLSFIFVHINKKNMLMIAILIFVSSTQYILFWGVYHVDILFFIILFTSTMKGGNKISSWRNFNN